MNDGFDGAVYPTGVTPTSHRRQTTYPRQTHTFVNYQAAVADVTKSKRSPLSAKNGRNSGTEPRSHPTMRLSHIQHNTSSSVISQQDETDMTSAKKAKYHEAVSQSTRNRFEQELSNAFAMPLGQGSRDEVDEAQQPAQRKARVSLAATHPSLYHHSPQKPLPPSMQSDRAVSLSPDQSSFSPLPSSSSPPVELPWRKAAADPKWQTSSDPHYWTVNRTVLKADTSVEHGNVVSPAFMIGAGFSSMTVFEQMLTRYF